MAPVFIYLGASASFAAFAAVAIRTILVNVAMNYLQRSAMRRARQELPPVNVTIRNPVENRRIIFGRVRASSFSAVQ